MHDLQKRLKAKPYVLGKIYFYHIKATIRKLFRKQQDQKNAFVKGMNGWVKDAYKGVC